MHNAKKAMQSVLAPRIRRSRNPISIITINADGSGTVFTVKSADSADACSASAGSDAQRIRVIVISVNVIMKCRSFIIFHKTYYTRPGNR